MIFETENFNDYQYINLRLSKIEYCNFCNRGL